MTFENGDKVIVVGRLSNGPSEFIDDREYLITNEVVCTFTRADKSALIEPDNGYKLAAPWWFCPDDLRLFITVDLSHINTETQEIEV